MNKLLLDTHILLWSLLEPERFNCVIYKLENRFFKGAVLGYDKIR
jgi:PIN domain nuclease of toxin-antitoxin system